MERLEPDRQRDHPVVSPSGENVANPGEFAGKRVTVMGLGHFGGGIGAVQYLARHGAVVTVTDLKSAEQLADSIAELGDTPPAVWRLGNHDASDFSTADLVVASPAVPWQHPLLQAARGAGVPVSSEMNLFWDRNPAATVCVTGTVGKSTTTAMIAHLIGASSRRVWLGGNIGRSLLPALPRIQADDTAVLELSSFQLEAMCELKPRPHVAVITNFAPNHLDRHGTLDEYRRCKQILLSSQTANDFAVLNADDPDVAQWETAAKTHWFGPNDTGRLGAFLASTASKSSERSEVVLRTAGEEVVWPLTGWQPMRGEHNVMNALAAACAARLAGVPAATIRAAMPLFTALPHRLQRVANVAGREFYNDSKATTPESTIRALDAFTEPIWLIAGGADKQVDLRPLAIAIRSRRVCGVALMGATADLIHSVLESAAAGDDANSSGPTLLIQHCSTMRSAVEWCFEQSRAGDVILLSPACASYGLFQNFEHRGDAFAACVTDLSARHSPQ